MSSELARPRTFPQHTLPLLPLLRSRPGGVHKASVVRSPGSDKPCWRRGWDSNPRNGFPFTAFPVLPVQPLLHLSYMSILKNLVIVSKTVFRESLLQDLQDFQNNKTRGGEGGIRTHGGRKPTPVFETGALIHYATSPRLEKLLHQRAALRFKHACTDLNPVIQKICIADAKATRNRARSFIRGTVN